MKKIIVIVLIFIASQNIFAQSGWQNVFSNQSLGNLNNVFFVNPQVGFVVGEGGTFLKTTNAGVNWNLSTVSNQYFRAIYFINEQTGFIGSGWSSMIFKTTNSGVSWDSTSVEYRIYSIYFLNNTTGFFCTTNGIYKTVDAGNNWNLFFNVESTSDEGSIHFLNATTGYYWITYRGAGPAPDYWGFYKTTNGGTNWNYISGANYIQCFSMKFVNENIGFAALNNFRITTNGGLNWIAVLSNIFNDYACEINFLPPNIIYRGSYKSTNLGLNWSLYNLNTTSARSLFFIDANTGILTTGIGEIKRTTDGGEFISSITPSATNEFPDYFFLQQNYPNPFNPSTKINYEIKSSGFVSLKVFDLLGKEVASLVNEKQNAGSYAVDFNSAEFNLPNGIYFYSLNAGEFNETKKMVLVK